MANPQKEKGYTAIANEIMEALAGIRISGEARQILDSIIRKTYGFNKKEDAISISQFQRMTRMKKPTVVRAIRKLQEMRLIVVIKNDNHDTNIYSINKDYDDWEPLPKKIINNVRESTLKKFCYVCGFAECIERHHILPINKGGKNRIENKIILCPNCHTMAHRGKHTIEFLKTKKDNVENETQKDNVTPIEAEPKKIPTKVNITKETITKVKKRFIKPTSIELINYFMTKKGDSKTEAEFKTECFIDFYEGKGWMIGKNKMVSWTHTASRAYREWDWDRKKRTKKSSCGFDVVGGSEIEVTTPPTRAEQIKSFEMRIEKQRARAELFKNQKNGEIEKQSLENIIRDFKEFKSEG